MKRRNTYIIASAASFLLALPIANVMFKGLIPLFVPEEVKLTVFSISGPMYVEVLFSFAVAITLALLPVSALILQNRRRFLVVIVVTILVGIGTALIIRGNIHTGIDMAQQLVPTVAPALSLKQLHLEGIPLACVLAVVVSTILLNLNKKSVNISATPAPRSKR